MLTKRSIWRFSITPKTFVAVCGIFLAVSPLVARSQYIHGSLGGMSQSQAEAAAQQAEDQAAAEERAQASQNQAQNEQEQRAQAAQQIEQENQQETTAREQSIQNAENQIGQVIQQNNQPAPVTSDNQDNSQTQQTDNSTAPQDNTEQTSQTAQAYSQANDNQSQQVVLQQTPAQAEQVSEQQAIAQDQQQYNSLYNDESSSPSQPQAQNTASNSVTEDTSNTSQVSNSLPAGTASGILENLAQQGTEHMYADAVDEAQSQAVESVVSAGSSLAPNDDSELGAQAKSLVGVWISLNPTVIINRYTGFINTEITAKLNQFMTDPSNPSDSQ